MRIVRRIAVSKRGAIHRYYLIVEKVSRGGMPSFAAIKRQLEAEGFELDERTLRRDLQDLREEYGLELRYDRARNGYALDSGAPGGAEIVPFLKAAMEAELLVSSFADLRATRGLVEFSGAGNFRGAEWLGPIFTALKERRELEFDHAAFGADEALGYVVRPLRLKEYEGRWYLVAALSGKPGARVFGLDRIERLEVTDRVFPASARPRRVDAPRIGVSGFGQPAIDVTLDFEPFQGNYLKSLPLHESQEILEDNEERFVVKIHVVDNYELRRIILGYGADVAVLEPRGLAEEIAAIHEKSAAIHRQGRGLS